MKTKTKKLIAPFVITTVLCIYYLGIGILFLCIGNSSWLTGILAVVIPLLLTAVSVGVLVQRINEIRKGEEDDLSKY